MSQRNVVFYEFDELKEILIGKKINNVQRLGNGNISIILHDEDTKKEHFDVLVLENEECFFLSKLNKKPVVIQVEAEQ